MFGSKDRHDDTPTRTRDDVRPHGTTTDADVTARMTGSQPAHARVDRDHDGVDDRSEGTAHAVAPAAATRTDVEERYEERRRVLPARTSVAAAFALVFGVAALFCALTGILAPAAVLLGLIGLVLGVVGMKKGRLPGITGRGVALGGLITAVLGLVLGAAVLAGAAVFVNDEQNLDRLQTWIDDARAELPSGDDIVERVPGS